MAEEDVLQIKTLKEVLLKLNARLTALENLTDDTAVKNIREVEDGVEFLDGNGNVVYKLKVME